MKETITFLSQQVKALQNDNERLRGFVHDLCEPHPPGLKQIIKAEL